MQNIYVCNACVTFLCHLGIIKRLGTLGLSYAKNRMDRRLHSIGEYYGPLFCTIMMVLIIVYYFHHCTCHAIVICINIYSFLKVKLSCIGFLMMFQCFSAGA